MSKTLMRRVGILQEALMKRAKIREGRYRIEEVTFCEGYTEPGYTDPKSGVIAFGNWNKVREYVGRGVEVKSEDHTPCVFAKALENMGVEIEWSDEWTTCEQCQKAVRTSADSYSWQRSYWDNEGSIICHECVLGHKPTLKAYLEAFEDQGNRCVTLEVDLAKHGYQKVDRDFENGWYGGQDDDPREIAKALRERGITRFIFNLDSVGQFDFKFSLWVHKSEIKKLVKRPLGDREGKAALDPAEGLRLGLQAAGEAAAKVPPGAGPVVTKIGSDGTATAKRVSPKDFVEGKALD